MPSSKQNSSRPQAGTRIFRGVRDPLVNNSAATTPVVYSMNTDGAGAFSGSVCLSPLGISGLVFSVPNPNTAGTAIVPSITTMFSPFLPWLYNQAKGFEQFRVTRATAIWVSNLGSTATGRVMLDSSTDYADAVSANGISTSTGGKVFDLASGASKEFRHQMDVDSSWKKCSSATLLVSTPSNIVTPVNSINDLSFTTIFVTITGGPNSTNCGSLFVDYDVEFKDPISFGANI